MRELTILKMCLCTIVAIAGLYFFSTSPTEVSGYLVFFVVFISLVGISSVRDRDYSKEPVTDAEAKIKMERMKIEHLESEEHANGDCDPCPYSGAKQ